SGTIYRGKRRKGARITWSRFAGRMDHYCEGEQHLTGVEMGLSIRAISKATFVDCNGYVDEAGGELCDHDEALQFPLGREGLKPGCHHPGKGGRSFSFEIGYSAYAQWFDELYQMLYGLDADGLLTHYRRHRG